MKVKKFRKLAAGVLAAAMVTGVLATSALAVEYDISLGDVTITSESSTGWQVGATEATTTALSVDSNIVISGSSFATDDGGNRAVGEDGCATIEHVVILQNATIDNSQTEYAGLTIKEGADVVIELDGVNSLTGGAANVQGRDQGKAGLSVGKDATVTIQDTGTEGSLTAEGGYMAAGIGGDGPGALYEKGSDAGNIVITGGTINATGGKAGGAGIGSSVNGTVGDISIYGGTITAEGGSERKSDANNSLNENAGAAIGAGKEMAAMTTPYYLVSVGTITIAGGNVTASMKARFPNGSECELIGKGHTNTSSLVTVTNVIVEKDVTLKMEKTVGAGGSTKKPYSETTSTVDIAENYVVDTGTVAVPHAHYFSDGECSCGAKKATEPTDPSNPPSPPGGGSDPVGPYPAEIETQPEETNTTIEDEETPLSGVVTNGDLIEYLFEDEADMSEFMAWAVENGYLDEAVDLEEPITVGTLKAILSAYAEYLGIEIDFEIEGEDADVVLNLAEILADFFAQINA